MSAQERLCPLSALALTESVAVSSAICTNSDRGASMPWLTTARVMVVMGHTTAMATGAGVWVVEYPVAVAAARAAVVVKHTVAAAAAERARLVVEEYTAAVAVAREVVLVKHTAPAAMEVMVVEHTVAAATAAGESTRAVATTRVTVVKVGNHDSRA